MTKMNRIQKIASSIIGTSKVAFVYDRDKEEVVFTSRLSRIASEDGAGGSITFSTDVNVGTKGILGKVKSWVKTLINRVNRTNVVQKLIDKAHGKYGKVPWGGTLSSKRIGFYEDDSGERHEEWSFVLDVFDAPTEYLRYLGKKIASVFEQESVYVAGKNTGKSYFLKPA